VDNEEEEQNDEDASETVGFTISDSLLKADHGLYFTYLVESSF
jgi:hypothetical protein